jgi:hypothetical protein
MTYVYSVITTYDDCKCTCETNNINVAISAAIDSVEAQTHFDLIDNYTGEVLFSYNPEDATDPIYIIEEMRLTVVGWLTLNFPDAIPFFSALF